MIRTFLAVELSEEVRRQLAQIQLDLRQRLSRDMTQEMRIAWVQPASIHLTIKFLGDTNERLVETLRVAAKEVVKPHLPIQIPLERLGTFPHAQQPRVLWVGPQEKWANGQDAARLDALHRVVEGCCQLLGFAPEGRPLSPHLTLARIKDGQRQVGQALAKSGVMDRPVRVGSFMVASIVLMKSELRPTGSVYTKLWEIVAE